MMNFRRSLLFIFFSVTGISCTQEIILDEDNNAFTKGKSTFVIEATLEVPEPDTKTALSSDMHTVVWNANDAISLLDDNGQSSEFFLVYGEGTTSGTFGGEELPSVPYTAFYPSSGNASISESILSFHIPQNQVYANDSFGAQSLPMVARGVDDLNPLQFKNLCGLVCISLKSKPTMTVSRLKITDLDEDHVLWGDCSIALDGKEGTADQSMTIDGGDNTLILNLPSPITISESVGHSFFIVVPPGSFSEGFSVTIIDDNHGTQASLKTFNPNVVIERSMISNMSQVCIKPEQSDVSRRGYYKDLFMDSGLDLTSRTTLPGCKYIGWDMEYFATIEKNSKTVEDTLHQRAVFEVADDDLNGYLLYPDRQPRFRCIYVNGGNSRTHGYSLKEAGRSTIYDFVYNGGSYVGSCAGAFLTCKGYDEYEDYPYYTKIFPGHMYHTSIKTDYPDMVMPADCPLRQYYTFGETISRVRHNKGGYMSENEEHLVPGAEVLLRFGTWPTGPTTDEGKASCWAYKPSEKTGRMVVIGSHPEGETSGPQRDLFAAMLRYAADGHGATPVKAHLSKNVSYDCSSLSSENNPEHARIGDKQYHHFTVDIPVGAQDVTISLESEWEDEDLYLSVKKNDFAWFSDADYTLTTDGSNKAIHISTLSEGTYYVSVYAPNTVTSSLTKYQSASLPNKNGYYYKYTGKTHLLNGIPYSIKVDWTL